MFELIIIIIIISVVLKSKNKKVSSKPNATSQQRAPQVRPQQSAPIPSRTVQNKPQQSRTVQSKPVKEEMSTTEMLEAKALADDREEMLEKQRQRMENKKHYGDLKYAEKYVLGDMVPKGKKMVFCPYCNAENLIPTYSAAKDYNCYFCRENL